MINKCKSNIEIKSRGDRHSVFVGGVEMLGVFDVAVNYEVTELPVITIKVKMPCATTKIDGDCND